MVLLDGAAGTTLWEIAERNGVKREAVWKYNMEHPELVTCLHREMIDAGAQIIITNTFAANPSAVRRQSEYESRERFAEILRPAFPLLSFLGGCCNCKPSYIGALRRSMQDAETMRPIE